MNSNLDGATDPRDLTRPLYGASFGAAVRRYLGKYATFSGRASRSEFWWSMLFVWLVNLVPAFLATTGALMTMQWTVTNSVNSYNSYYSWEPSAEEFFGSPGIWMLFAGLGLSMVLWLAFIVPTAALYWRRLHDANLAGPLFFLMFVPGGSLALIIMALLPSRIEGRRFDVQR
jgi:uncharacterized membrane protein YhaH (DUF805 family)